MLLIYSTLRLKAFFTKYISNDFFKETSYPPEITYLFLAVGIAGSTNNVKKLKSELSKGTGFELLFLNQSTLVDVTE